MTSPSRGTLIVLGLAVIAIAVVVSFVAPWGTSSKSQATTAATAATTNSGVASSGVANSGVANSGVANSGVSNSPSRASGQFESGSWVHVVGEVKTPGLYSVPFGSRVVDAVMAAGGLTESADQCSINLARLIADGEQLVVPARVDSDAHCVVSTGGSSSSAGALISLSRADLATLDSLPGIGPTLAQRIIDWRNAHGGFTSVEQLGDVSGIGDKLYAELVPLVTP